MQLVTSMSKTVDIKKILQSPKTKKLWELKSYSYAWRNSNFVAGVVLLHANNF